MGSSLRPSCCLPLQSFPLQSTSIVSGLRRRGHPNPNYSTALKIVISFLSLRLLLLFVAGGAPRSGFSKCYLSRPQSI
jgi:hypothetical protein